MATEAYSLDELDDTRKHLTNYAINKKSDNYEFNEDADEADTGSKRTLTSVLRWLEDNGYDADAAWEGIKAICVKTCLTAQPLLAHTYNTCFHGANYGASCFEILGFDIMFDHKLQPWLIEVRPPQHTAHPTLCP